MNSRAKVLETILVLVLALGIAYWFTNKNSPELGRYLLFAALIIGLIGLFIPPLASLIHAAWMKLAHALGFVMSKVLLTLIYVIFLLPLALLSRLFKKNQAVKLKKSASSYFVDRNFTYTKESMENVW